MEIDVFIVQLTYKAPLNEVDKYLPAHREFLDYYYKQGLFLASGPMKPRVGGIIIALKQRPIIFRIYFTKNSLSPR